MFKAGDKIRMLEECCGCDEGEIYTLIPNRYGFLMADNNNDGGCECQDKWELISRVTINVRELNKSIKI